MSAATARITMLGDTVLRRKHKLLLSFSGGGLATSGAFSMLDVQNYIFENLPNILNRFPDYQSFFTVSTWLSFVAGLLFFIAPVMFTVWLGTHLVGISILYLFGGAQGIAEISFWAFVVPYWGWVLAVLLANAGDNINFYFKNTIVDGYALIGFKLGFFVWAFYIFFDLDF